MRWHAHYNASAIKHNPRTTFYATLNQFADAILCLPNNMDSPTKLDKKFKGKVLCQSYQISITI